MTRDHREPRPHRPRLAALALAAALGAWAPASAQQAGAHSGAQTGAARTLVVLNKGEATVSLLDAATGAVQATLATGEGPHEVAVSPDRRLAVVTDYGQRTPGRTLTVIDLVARRPIRTIDLGEFRRPHGVAWLPDGRRVAVTAEANRALVIVDVERGAVEGSVPTGQDGSHMVVVSPDGRHAWVANIASGSVTMVDLVQRTAARTARTGAGAEGITVSPDGRELWVTNREENTVSVLDALSLEERARIPSADFPIRVKITPDGRRALVSNARSSELRVFDVATRQPLATVRFPLDSARARPTLLGARFGGSAVPIGILIAPDGRRAWVAMAGTDEIAVVDLERLEVTGYWRAGREPDGLGI